MTENKGASMSEPVAWQAKQKVHIQYLYDKISADYAQANGWAITPLYAHPAPAPASLRDMTEADFDKAHGIAPAGVPDVDGLIERLRTRAVDYTRNARPDTARIVSEAAEALAALQSHSKAIDAEYAFARKRLLALAGEIATKERENAQQAERINALTAKLAEAVGLLERNASQRWPLSPSDHTIDGDTAAFLNKAREVMG